MVKTILYTLSILLMAKTTSAMEAKPIIIEKKVRSDSIDLRNTIFFEKLENKRLKSANRNIKKIKRLKKKDRKNIIKLENLETDYKKHFQIAKHHVNPNNTNHDDSEQEIRQKIRADVNMAYQLGLGTEVETENRKFHEDNIYKIAIKIQNLENIIKNSIDPLSMPESENQRILLQEYTKNINKLIRKKEIIKKRIDEYSETEILHRKLLTSQNIRVMLQNKRDSIRELKAKLPQSKIKALLY